MPSRQKHLSLPVRKTRSNRGFVKPKSDSDEEPTTTPVKHRKCLDLLEVPCSPSKLTTAELATLEVTSKTYTLRTPESSFEKCSGKPTTPSREYKINKENFASLSQSSEESPCKVLDQLSKSTRKTFTPIRLFQQNVSIYQEAKRAFVTGVSTNLCCREEEIARITGFLERHLMKKEPGSLYISGAPGTGKTACLNQILSAVQFQKIKYKIIFINCANLSTPRSIFEQIYTEMQPKHTDKQTAPPTDYSKWIKKHLISKTSMVLLILDEIDFLDNRDQSILYTIFEWVTLENSQLVLLGIANALDLTNRTLPRLQMHINCKPELLHFPPYNKEQILMILQERLKQVSDEARNLIKPAALQFCARKVASFAGDIRKALDVCRRALDLAETDIRKQQVLQPCQSPKRHNASSSLTVKPAIYKCVELPLIMSVLNEVYGTRLTKGEQHSENSLPVQQKIMLCTLLLLVKNEKLREVSLGKFHEVYSRICKKHQITSLDQSEFTNLCTLVEARGLIRIKKHKNIRMAKVTFMIDDSEVEYTLQDKCLLASILSNTSCLGSEG